MSVGLHIKLLF